MSTEFEHPQDTSIARRLSFGDDETQSITTSLQRFTAESSECYEIERNLLSLKERMRPLKFKLKHLLAKQLFCERLMLGGANGLSSIIPDDLALEHAKATHQRIKEEKQGLSEQNEQLTHQLSQTVSQILGAQMELQETIDELDHIGEDSPYIPCKIYVNSSLSNPANVQQQAAEQQIKFLKLAASQLESRLKEVEDNQKSTSLLSGFVLDSWNEEGACFIFNVSCLNDKPDILALITDFIRSSQSDHIILDIQWTKDCQLTEVHMSCDESIFEDIFSIGISDNSPSFIIREVSNRLFGLVNRVSEIKRTQQSIQARRHQNIHALHTPAASQNITIAASMENQDTLVHVVFPWEYPNVGARIVNVTDTSAEANQLTQTLAKFKLSKFRSLDTLLESIGSN